MSRRHRTLLTLVAASSLLTFAPMSAAHADPTGPFTITIDAPGGTHAYGVPITATVTVLDACGAPTPDVTITAYADNSWCNDQPTGVTDATGTATLQVGLYCRQDLVALADSSTYNMFGERSQNSVHEEVTLPLTLSVPAAKRPYWAVRATVGGLELSNGLNVDPDRVVIQRQTSRGWRDLTGMVAYSDINTKPLVWDAHAGTHPLRLWYPGDHDSDGWAPSASPTANLVVGTGRPPAWLKQFNYYRHLARLPKVGEDPFKDAADRAHINYMVKNDYYGHFEDENNSYYSRLGYEGGTGSDLYKGIACNKAIPGWMVTPYHSEPMLNQQMYTAGFACQKGYAALYVNDDPQPVRAASLPQTWPADGAKMPLHRFGGGEIPDPLTHCPAKWAKRRDSGAGMGAALLAFTQTRMTGLRAHLTNNGNRTPVCAFRDFKTTYLLPLYPLKGKHTYRVRLTSDKASLSWSFHG